MSGLTFTALFLPDTGESSGAVSHSVTAVDIDVAASLAVRGCDDGYYLAAIWQVGVSADTLAFHADPTSPAAHALPREWVHPFSAERVAERQPSEHQDALDDLNAHLERKSAQDHPEARAYLRATQRPKRSGWDGRSQRIGRSEA